MTNTEARNELWRRGSLEHLLYPHQLILYRSLWDAINNEKCLKYALTCARRFGKSTILVLIAISFAIKNPGAQIRFAAPTQRALKKITHPIFRIMLKTCPLELRPRYFSQDSLWKFPNGSEIHTAGTDNQHFDSLRGTSSHLNVVDEAGFCEDLLEIVNSILLPQTLTTGGTTLMASTPPRSPAHDFYSFVQECESSGFYSKFDVYANKSLAPETIAKFILESGGAQSTTWRREYLVEFIVDEEIQIVPEWKPEYIRSAELDEFRQFYHNYISMDLGVVDFTATLFAHYDFRRATLYVTDELTMSGPEMTTDKLKDAIRIKERENFGAWPTYRRVADNNNLLLLQDLGSLHGLHFMPTDKDSLEAMVNEVRIFVGAGRLIVSPKCKMLIGNLKYGIFDERHRTFARSTIYKHFDHLAALIYMIRNIDQTTNPVPNTYGLSTGSHWLSSEGKLNHPLSKLSGFGRKG